MTLSWKESVKRAILRQTTSTGNQTVTNDELRHHQLDQIVRETGSTGKTPSHTLNRELMRLRDEGFITFVDDRGTYRLGTFAVVRKPS